MSESSMLRVRWDNLLFLWFILLYVSLPQLTVCILYSVQGGLSKDKEWANAMSVWAVLSEASKERRSIYSLACDHMGHVV